MESILSKSIFAIGSITPHSLSSKSLKAEFKLSKLKPKYNEVHKGLIAQDVKEIFPDVVKRENADAYWTITHQEVDIYFNMGVQELIKRDKETEKQKAKGSKKKKSPAENVVLGPAIIGGVSENNVIIGGGCIEILKGGAKKGNPCGVKILANSLCRRHNALNGGVLH